MISTPMISIKDRQHYSNIEHNFTVMTLKIKIGEAPIWKQILDYSYLIVSNWFW